MKTTFDQGYALLIGVGNCSTMPSWSLPITVNDAKVMRDALVDPNLCAYPANDDHIRFLSNETATKQGIIEGLDWLNGQLKKNDNATAVVYFSGHGWIEKETGQYFLIPSDVSPFKIPQSSVAAADFTQQLLDLPAKRKLIILDCCHAQGMAEAKGDALEDVMPPNYANNALPEPLVNQLGAGEGTIVFTSCKGSEKSYIAPFDQNSLYTKHFLEALSGIASKPGDTTVKISTLMGHLGEAVPAGATALNRVQTPIFKMESEDFSVALLLGGKGLSGAGWQPEQAQPQPSTAGTTFNANFRGDNNTVIQAGGNVATSNNGGISIGGNVEKNVTINKP